MNNLTHLGGGVFHWVIQTTWQAAVLAGLILLAQLLLRKRLPPSWRYGLWLLLVVRLLMPVSPQSAFSIFNLARNTPMPSIAASPPPIAPEVSMAEPVASLARDVPAFIEPREAPQPFTPPPVKTDWFGVALWTWLAGVCFFGARLVWTNGRFRSRIGRYQPVADENAMRLLNDCRAAYKITQPVRLIESEEVESPAVYGFWRKWLLLPDGVFERFSTEELRCIFLHELAHIKRGDVGVNWLVALLQVLHWFNPVLWLAWARMRADRELATDALALRHVRENDRAPYGETILKVLEGLTGERALPGLVGIVESKAQLKERLTAIARPGKHWKWAALTTAALIAVVALTSAQTEKNDGKVGLRAGAPDALSSWGRVEGVLRLNNHPAGNEKIGLWEDRLATGEPSRTITTDEQGRFVFDHVSSGDYTLFRFIAFSNQISKGETTCNPIHFEVRSGETTNLAWGGNGRPVVGKCVVGNTEDLLEHSPIFVRLDSPYSLPPATVNSPRKLAEWRKSEAGRKALQSNDTFGACAVADGSFQVDDVAPGTYQLSFWVESRQSASQPMKHLTTSPKQIVVPPLSNPAKCESFDLGAVETSFVEPTARASASQPVQADDSKPVVYSKRLEEERQNPAGTPPELTLHGRIVDAKGAPIAGATVKTFGISTKDGGGRRGRIDGVDSSAISDEQGQFVITSRRPFTSLDVKVEAHGFARKSFMQLTGGSHAHELVMAVGATLKGRVLDHGKPLANVSVGAVSADRTSDNFTGNFEAATDADGRFEFVNLPAEMRYNVYGLMKSLHAYGYIPILTADTGADGSTTDMGDLAVQPAHRLSGRVTLGDGKELPPETVLRASRKGTWDSMVIDLDKDGHFDATGIPDGTISLGAQITGYRPSAKNASLDQLNPFGLLGRVDHDITNLVLLMDKGPRLRSHFENDANGADAPENNPLRGAENAGDNSRLREISGRVTDAKTGEPVARFRVTPGRLKVQFDELDWNPLLAVDGTNGNYIVDADRRGGDVLLKFEAEGYLPAASSRLTAGRDHCDFSLTKGGGPAGTVLLPGGQPAAGVKVLLACPQSPGARLLCLIGGGNFQASRDETSLATTDAAGHFSLAPQFDMKAVAASGSEGFKLVTLESLRTNAQITLEPWGKIKGVLHRPSGPGTNQALILGFTGKDASHALALAIGAKTDDKGIFEFDQVPPGDCEIETIVSVGEDAADTEELQKVHVVPGQTTEVTIEAPAKAPPIMIGGVGRRGGRGDGVPPVKSWLQGTAVLPDGTPVADAQVGLKIPSQELEVGDGELIAGPMNDNVTRTLANGAFTIPMRDTATALYLVNEAGFARLMPDQWTNGVKVILQPWGRVEGVLRSNGKPAPNEKIRLAEDNEAFLFDTGGFRSIIRTDDQGHFVFAHVPPGDCQLSRCISIGNGWTTGYTIRFTVHSGETTNLVWGGKGRPVVGKCVVENVKDLPENSTFMVGIHTPYPIPPATAGETNRFISPRKMTEWRKSEAGRKAMQNYRDFDAMVAADGSFQVDDVTPGTYALTFSIRGGADRPRDMKFLNSPPQQIVVPPLSDPEKYEPFNLGALKMSFTEQRMGISVTSTTNKLKAGDVAPAFATKTLGGRPLRLKDYRGKYVLLELSYQLPAANPDEMEALNDSFAKDDRFVIISLAQNADDDYVKKLSDKGVKHWIQGNLDFNAMGNAYGLDGAQFPLAFLIDPQGNIAATGLSGEAIQSTVALALAKK